MSLESLVDRGGESLPETRRRSMRPMMIAGVALILVASGAYVLRSVSAKAVVASPERSSAQPIAASVSPAVDGVVLKVNVTEGQVVKKGDLLLELDPKLVQSELDKAEAALAQAKSETRQAVAKVGLAGELGDPSLLKNASQSGSISGVISTSNVNLTKFHSAVADAQAKSSAARAALLKAEAASKDAEGGIAKAKDAVFQAQAKLEGAEADAKAAEANLEAETASRDKAQKDSERYAMLLEKGVVPANTAKNAATKFSVAVARVEEARAAAQSARAEADKVRIQIETAQSKVGAAESAVPKTAAAVLAARKLFSDLDLAAKKAMAELQSASARAQSSRSEGRQILNALTAASTAPVQVQVTPVPAPIVDARIDQAENALKQIQTKLAQLKIYAPVSGRVRGVPVAGEVARTGVQLLSIESN